MLFFVPSTTLVDAACRDIPESCKKWFFQDSAKAKKICEGCPVIAACLKEALSTGSQGVWGGTTYTERKRMKVSRERSSRPISQVEPR